MTSDNLEHINHVEEAETTMDDFGIFLDELKQADPDMCNILDDMLENYDTLLHREVRKKEVQKKAIKKYFQSEKGKLRNREANKRYYYKNKTSDNKVGRPKKDIE
tara:strand:- start:621 stop:935 length:315 start_codon:yes stop_codon:yes gene_type:complete